MFCFDYIFVFFLALFLVVLDCMIKGSIFVDRQVKIGAATNPIFKPQKFNQPQTLNMPPNATAAQMAAMQLNAGIAAAVAQAQAQAQQLQQVIQFIFFVFFLCVSMCLCTRVCVVYFAR